MSMLSQSLPDLMRRLTGRAPHAEAAKPDPVFAPERIAIVRNTAPATRRRLSPRAGELRANLGNALTAIETALIATDTIRGLVGEALEFVEDAATIADDGKRLLIAERYDDIRTRVDTVAGKGQKNGVSLTNGQRAMLEVALDESGKARHAVRAVDLTCDAKGLDLPAPEQGFATGAELAQVRTALKRATAKLDRASGIFLDDAAVLAAALTPLIEQFAG